MNESSKSIRAEISAILGVAVLKNGYKQAFNELDRAGKIDNRTLMRCIIVLCNKLDKIEELLTPYGDTNSKNPNL